MGTLSSIGAQEKNRAVSSLTVLKQPLLYNPRLTSKDFSSVTRHLLQKLITC